MLHDRNTVVLCRLWLCALSRLWVCRTLNVAVVLVRPYAVGFFWTAGFLGIVVLLCAKQANVRCFMLQAVDIHFCALISVYWRVRSTLHIHRCCRYWLHPAACVSIVS